MDARMTAHQNLQQQEDEEQQRMMYQRQLQEEDYNRRIASPGGSSSSRMSRQQLVQRRLERRRQERRLKTTDLQSQTTLSEPIHQPPPPPPPPPSEKSPISIMKKSSSYQTMSDQQQYFHNQQRQPQHSHNTSSNYSSDSSGNYISPPILNRKQPFPDGPSYPNSNSHNVFTQNGVVIDRTAFRPTRNRLRLPHESPSDEWSRNGSPKHQSRNRRGQYQQQQQQFQQHPQLYVPDTPSQTSGGSYDAQGQIMRGNNRQPNWQQLDQQRLMYQRQEASRHRQYKGHQQNNVSYVSDDEDTYNNGHVNTSFNSHANTVKTRNRARSLSRERQLPRRWRHKHATASVGRGGMSQASDNSPRSAEESPQFQYTPRSRLAVTESLGQSEVNTSMSSSQNGRHGWRQQNTQHIQNHGHGWGAQDDRQSQHTHQNVVSPARSENSHFSDRDQESVSVASIRKSWEGRVEQQRGRARDTSYDRRHNTGDNQFGTWEGRDSNRDSHFRQGETRREQNRNRNNNWKRNSSLPPPERRRGGGLRHEEYYDADGYQSDGGYRSQPERIEVDAAHVSIHDARRRLWDQEERLRAVLPQADSFDSYGDGRHRRPIPSVGLASPGNVSTLSTGSALFKSKFVHAAALATQQRDLPVDGGNHSSPRQPPPPPPPPSNFHYYPNKREDESPKGSSQITDSTADTTAPSSNHTSHGENARKQPAQPTATMPPIAEARPVAETPQASVAGLIARINAVSRDNPAEALARIDSIIKGESAGNVKPRQHDAGVSSLFNFDAAKKPVAANKRASLGKATNQPAAVPQVEQKWAFNGDDHNDDANDDASVDDSVSSGESTVSSMTNPTYQSVHESRRRKSFADLERKSSSPQAVTTRARGAEKQTFSNNREPRSNRVNGDDGGLTKAKLKSFDKSNDWTASAPQNDFFTEFGGFRNASTQAVASSRTMQIKKNSTWNESSTPHHEEKALERPATPDIMNAVSSAFSDVNISFGDTGATQDLLAKAFSDVGQKCKEKKQNAVTNAFSDVDISMEKKTVSQRRKELELLSKSMTGASDDDAGNLNQNTSSAFDWDIDDPTPTKQKKKSEPTLRLKTNKKLTQKFANLVKAFEHF